MAKRIANTQLNGRTIDILNVIRTNASYEYQQNVPLINDAQGIPRVGETLYGNPTLANEFINALVNRIALVMVNSAVFYSPYNILLKGFLEFGETVEEIFVKIIKVQEFSPEKAVTREFKRTIPDVQSAFHTMNWRVLYPITIQREDLKRAFLSVDGVESLINSIIEQVYVSAQYDIFLLTKYMLIKAISHGKAYPISVSTTDEAGLKETASKFRGTSNMLQFMKDTYNEAGVLTTTPKERQVIFMDANFQARFDVNVLASAFNMEKADFMGRLLLIDDWNTFDNARFDEIRENSDQIEEVTAEELALMASVKAVLVDESWFQIYDNETVMTDQRVASGLYWNYFYHTWKTISHSPFSNIIAFVEDTASIALPESLSFTVSGIVTSDVSTVVNLEQADNNSETLASTNYRFVETETAVTDGIAVHPYGSIIFPSGKTTFTPELLIGTTTYTGTELDLAELEVNAPITFTKE